MRKVLNLLLLLIIISCTSNSSSYDITDSEFRNMCEESDIKYSLILSEEGKKGNNWKSQIQDANDLKISIESLLRRVDSHLPIDQQYINELKYNKGLLAFLPNEFNSLPKNYKKLIIMNYEQHVLSDLNFMCLIGIQHYFAIKSNVQPKKDTIRIGEEFSARISVLASNFRDSVFLYDENDSLVFSGIDSLGYVEFRKKELTRGLKVYRGYYKQSVLKDIKAPRIRIEYYVE